ncbi:MAG TPA: NAD-glutamate dehydrogenase [Kineosporiaceae bacterium]|nr:NAD-glutamate dehydrogenase [Kineosporiaceae bacterium]
MTATHQTDREQIIDRAAQAGERQGCREPGLRPFLARYYRHVALEDLRDRDPVDLVGAALSHRQLASFRPRGVANVRVFTPTVDEHAWACGHTVVEVATDDMPFLVDSINAELSRLDRAIHLVVHPQVVVRRDVTGNLLEILDLSASGFATGEHPRDALVESWTHVEIDRVTHPDDLEDIAASLSRVLEDVRVAVEDWPRMRQRAQEIAEELSANPPAGIEADQVGEVRRLLDWLADEHFTFVGYRDYKLEVRDGHDVLVGQTGTGLGILRYDQMHSSSFDRLTKQARSKAREKRLLVLTKANSRATVHRPSYLDYVGVKVFDAAGEVIGERRFLGLFASSVYTDSVRRIPVVERKVAAVLARSGFSLDSHSGKDLLQILETYPRDELFEIGVDELYEIAIAVMHLQERRRTRLFMRTDEYGRYVSCLVFLPRDRYTTAVRLRMEDILRSAFKGSHVDYSTRVTESVLARLHFIVRMEPGTPLPYVDPDELEGRLVEATRSWDEDLGDALRTETGEEEAARLQRVWGRGFPEAYKEDFPARVAVSDLRRIEDLLPGEAQSQAPGAGIIPGEALGMNLYEPVGAGPGERRFKLYRLAPLSLTAVLPYLAHLGVEVVDERPYQLERADGLVAHVYDFGLRYPGGIEMPDRAREQFSEAFAAAWAGQAESDGFDRLVLRAGLTWRQVVVLRAYAKYLRQTRSTFSQDYIEQCLSANVAIVRLLVRLFEARLDPDLPAEGRQEVSDALVAEIGAGLDGVASLDHDRILRAYLGLVLATLRTNFFQTEPVPGAAAGISRPKAYVSFKLDPQAVPDLPQPRPAFEIFVYSPRMEGVHLRFGKVARGGLRWSDRREDFRTEILGLVKAQMVKNAVIVPTGAKGGFVCKNLPDPAVDRDAWLAEGVACYQTFICGLLDITDNLVSATDGEGGSGGDGVAASGQQLVLPPPRVVRHDGDDTYLVVAADKGTASFSDIANGVSRSYGFWLGDAFASGGSVGYDHKAMGITAKGAWESVRRHFRELGRDVQSEDFTVVGIGDMSGDVFGNGMLLSRHITLVAAFDHRHVFLDPDPDPESSFAERQRLFALPRSSWADYDASLISAGGGVYPRTAKSIPVSPAVGARLGLAATVTALTPAELITAILSAPADLLWNGGIGTYVKASTESHADVGDKANDVIRVDARDLRVRVIGEGGNLGLSQLGRVEAALHGVRVNTDAFDNSAGVDCSDHEVNIKILLDRILAAGDLTEKQRNGLLAEMTDDVGRMVLRDNYEQNVLLGNARKQSHQMLSVHQRFMRSLESRKILNRKLEYLPSDAGLSARGDEDLGLTSPEFSVLVAYAKIALKEDLLASDLPDDPWFARILRDYFPPGLVDRYADRLTSHPLRREITATCLVNELVNRGGITFAFRAQEETAATPEQVARAYTVCREVFDLKGFVAEVEALDNVVSTDAQTVLYLEFRRLLDRAVRWFLQTRPGRLDIGAEIARFGPVVAQLGPRMSELTLGVERRAVQEHAEQLVKLGIPDDLALRGATLLPSFMLLDITEIAGLQQVPADEVAQVYLTLSERYAVDAMLTRISGLNRGDRWQALARAALRYDLYAALESLTTAVLTATAPGEPLDRVRQWEQENSAAVARAAQTLEEVRRLETGDIASLSVALRTLRGVVRSTT